MAKEFDIYLNRRVVECDLMVLSLPFRDGLTADNRMILDTCIEAYTLYKFVAAQSNAAIEQHIDEMLKMCYEMLSVGMTAQAKADFQVHYTMYPEDFAVKLQTKDISALANMFTNARNALQMGVKLIDASVGQSAGSGSTAINMDVALFDTIKNSMLTLKNQMAFHAGVGQTNMQSYAEADAGVELSAGIDNLCYRITDTAGMAVELAALVLGTEIHFSFGRAYANMSFSSSVNGSNLTKYEIINGTIGLLATLIETVTQYAAPSSHSMKMTMEAQSVVRRHRLLSEMDANTLEALGEMSLEDLYYVIIDE
ncbi:MAG: hypothetical protein IJ418_16255 [Clostridia bacterium]|nr:hypothetical protein [Clostridia bacterium]